jgi:hypothetical protein
LPAGVTTFEVMNVAMLLILYAALALIPLLGVVFIVLQGLIFTVDGLFLSLICLTMSGIFAACALLELRSAKIPTRPKSLGRSGAMTADGSGLVEQGRVESVTFFESHVGQPNKSVVTLTDGGAARTVILEGDVRNALPVGKKVAITCREEQGRRILLGVSYS